MKKNYVQPEVAVIDVELSEIIAASELTVDVDSETTGAPEDANARFVMFDAILFDQKRHGHVFLTANRQRVKACWRVEKQQGR